MKSKQSEQTVEKLVDAARKVISSEGEDIQMVDGLAIEKRQDIHGCAVLRLCSKDGIRMIKVEVFDEKDEWRYSNYNPVSTFEKRLGGFKSSMRDLDLPDPALTKSMSNPIYIPLSSHTTTPTGFGAN